MRGELRFMHKYITNILPNCAVQTCHPYLRFEVNNLDEQKLLYSYSDAVTNHTELSIWEKVKIL